MVMGKIPEYSKNIYIYVFTLYLLILKDEYYRFNKFSVSNNFRIFEDQYELHYLIL